MDQIVALVNERGYAGIEVDYRNVDPTLREHFTVFVRTLADRLHKQGKLLVVRVPTPRRISEDEFDSGAYDLVAIGQAADQVHLTAPVNPEAWVPGGDVDALLTWVTGKVNRYKLAVVVPTASYDLTQDGEPMPIRYEEAVRALSQVRLAGVEQGMAMPGQPVRLVVNAFQDDNVRDDPTTQTYQFTSTSPDGQWRVIVLANAASLGRKLDIVGRYAVGGVVVPDAEYADPRVWDLLAEYRQGSGSLPFFENQFALVWQLRNERGEQISSQVQSLDSGEVMLRAPEEPGVYQIAVAISDDGGATTYGDPAAQRIVVPTATPEPTATPTPTPAPSPTPVPPTPTPRPRGGGGNQGGGNQAGTKPPPSSPPPPSTAPSGPMAYGIQAHLIYQDKARIMRMIQGLGFNWVKQQIEWKVFEPAPRSNPMGRDGLNCGRCPGSWHQGALLHRQGAQVGPAAGR
ncbi:MAG: hypothetical protein Q9O62_09755 [Ardenticatenia bacterium]|nr:hypothetical protein [Ardenticatenia bacterium]